MSWDMKANTELFIIIINTLNETGKLITEVMALMHLILLLLYVSLVASVS